MTEDGDRGAVWSAGCCVIGAFCLGISTIGGGGGDGALTRGSTPVAALSGALTRGFSFVAGELS